MEYLGQLTRLDNLQRQLGNQPNSARDQNFNQQQNNHKWGKCEENNPRPARVNVMQTEQRNSREHDEDVHGERNNRRSFNTWRGRNRFQRGYRYNRCNNQSPQDRSSRGNERRETPENSPRSNRWRDRTPHRNDRRETPDNSPRRNRRKTEGSTQTNNEGYFQRQAPLNPTAPTYSPNGDGPSGYSQQSSAKANVSSQQNLNTRELSM